MAARAWRALVRGVRALLRPGAADAEADDEIRHFLDESTADLESRGLAAAEARRAARAQWGDAIALREQVRSSGWEHLAATAAADVRYGVRRLRRSPGFTTVAVVTLALGIGASTAIFSAVNPILFAPLPYPGGSQIVLVLENGRVADSTFAMYRTLLARSHALEAIAVFRRWQPTITGSGAPERVDGQRVSAGYFRVLGVAPALGRDLTADDDRQGGPAVAMLADALWRRRFGGDPAIVGRIVRLDDRPYTVIGVMPPRFENVLAPAAEIWTSLQYDPALPLDGREWGHHLTTLARLSGGITPAAAGREASTIGQAMIAERRPETYSPDTQFSVSPLHAELVRGIAPVLLTLSGAVLLVLGIACVNVTNLLLARAAQRRGELALRAALGAARARLVRQLLTESVLLAAAGGIAGVAFGAVAVRALAAAAPPGLPRASAIGLDGSVLAFALAVTTIAGLTFGLLPALESAGTDPQRDLHDASHRVAGRHGRVRRTLVIAEVGLAFVLLIGAGLLMRSVNGLLAVPVGFDAANLLTAQVPLVGRRFDADGAARQFYRQALDAVRRIPGVSGAAATSQLPLSGDRDEYGASFPERDGRPAGRLAVFRYAVTPGYFEVTGIPILRGRAIDDRDRAGAPRTAVISASLAAARFGGRDPIGATLSVGSTGPFTIVGIAGDVHQVSLLSSDAQAVYLNAEQWSYPERVLSVVVRGRGAPADLARAVQAAVWSVDRDQPVVRVATMADLITASAAERRFALFVFQGFAAVSLVLAAIGLYGVLAGGVTERTREIGLRAALGATRAQIVGLVVGQGLWLTAGGTVAGAIGAAVASRALATLLFGVSRLDPATYTGVAALLGGVALAACAVPAWRALRVDPSIALRAEP